MSLSLQVFGSSSSGNCTVLWNRHGAILIDCGFPLRYMLQRLHANRLALSSVRAVILTHIHGDHLHPSSLRALLDSGVPVACTAGVHAALQRKFPVARTAEARGLFHELPGEEPVMEGMYVRPFAVPHDVEGGCWGFFVTDDSGGRVRRVALATDVGYPREGLQDELSGADAIVLESNHDVGMLEHSGRPHWLIDRIRRIGHLSNEQSSGFLAGVVQRGSSPPAHVVLAHLSTQCNTPGLALAAANCALGRIGASSVHLSAAPPRTGGQVVSV